MGDITLFSIVVELVVWILGWIIVSILCDSFDESFLEKLILFVMWPLFVVGVIITFTIFGIHELVKYLKRKIKR